MLVGDHEKTSTKQPKGCLRWKMVWWVKGLMNHPILKDETSVGLLHTHSKGGEEVLMWNKIQSNGNMALVLVGIQ